MDVFLTPLFSTWLPKNCNDFYTGGGGYSHTFNDKRLSRTAKEQLHIEYAFVRNIGSSWYSTPAQFRIASYLSSYLMAYLAKEEFTQVEREGKVGTILVKKNLFRVFFFFV
jgi:hypothetical protein